MNEVMELEGEEAGVSGFEHLRASNEYRARRGCIEDILFGSRASFLCR